MGVGFAVVMVIAGRVQDIKGPRFTAIIGAVFMGLGFMLAGMMALLVLALALVPRKLLVFDDELRVKYLSYRSVTLSAADIEEVSLRRFSEVWLSSRLWRCLPLAIGAFAPAIYLRSRSGRSLYFRSRDTKELFELLSAMGNRPAGLGGAGEDFAGPLDASAD